MRHLKKLYESSEYTFKSLSRDEFVDLTEHREIIKVPDRFVDKVRKFLEICKPQSVGVGYDWTNKVEYISIEDIGPLVWVVIGFYEDSYMSIHTQDGKSYFECDDEVGLFDCLQHMIDSGLFGKINI